MIRGYRDKDLDKIMGIWLKGNTKAHSFIDEKYWLSKYNKVKEMMPQSDIYIYEENDKVLGFIGLMGSYIAGIFVLEKEQSKGIGKKLLDYVKNKNSELYLNVYSENRKAVDFYLRESFNIVENSVDEDTGENEAVMKWNSFD